MYDVWTLDHIGQMDRLVHRDIDDFEEVEELAHATANDTNKDCIILRNGDDFLTVYPEWEDDAQP